MLDKRVINNVIEKALSRGADFAELFIENTYNSSIKFNDSKTKQSIVGKDFGAGIRVFFGETAIYAFTSDLSESSLMQAADAVSKAITTKNEIQLFDFTEKETKNIHPFLIPATSIDKAEKIEFLRKIDNAARKYSNYISQVDLQINEVMQKIMIVNSEGLWTKDERNYTRLYTTTIAEDGSEKQTGSNHPGAFAGYEFIRSLNPEEIAIETAKSAVTMLKANYCPSGKFPVIIDNGFGGVIFHEACGHALETTSVAKGASVFVGKMGEQIANSVVTAIDDGTMINKWGSENIDDEGMPTQKTILIENGILKSYIVDKMGSLKTGYARTGSGRRQSYRFAPASRMRNTYIANGKSNLEEMLSTIDYGIYAKKMGGGSVMPGTGNFNFSVAEGYLVKNGKITEPVRGATLIGNGADALHKISMVGNNLELAEGMCGSVSGSIPTCVGQPAIKIDEIIVGGRKEK